MSLDNESSSENQCKTNTMKRDNDPNAESPPTKRVEASALDQLQKLSLIVADTGDFEAIDRYKPQDATTNPSLMLQACQLEKYSPIVKRVIESATKGRTEELKDSVKRSELVDDICDRLSVAFGAEILKVVPGRVSTEVDAALSFNAEKSIEKARKLIKLYDEEGIAKDRILIKMATTWEGCRAAEVLEKEGISCNLTLLFSTAQAVAASEAKATLISPFVGRILDWHVANTDKKTYEADEDPGVKSVREIYKVLKSRNSPTIVMGASFRNIGEILALAGCDNLTIAPKLLEELRNSRVVVTAKLEKPETITEPAPITEAEFRWQMNENAMATEKLAQGIRGFNSDYQKLKKLVDSKLDA